MIIIKVKEKNEHIPVTSKSIKAKTIFCDIDGTILKHQGRYDG